MNRPARRFAVFAVAFTGIRDFVPLYAVYALLFQAEGMSEAAISSLFLIWSVTSFVAEVPSGTLADLMSRRRLLSLSSLMTGLAFALWLLVPSFTGFAAGFVVWGIGGALASGTWESLIYDALAHRGATDRYAGIIGGGESAGWLAAMASAALATPMLATVGYALVGWTSVGVCVLHAGLALALPHPPRTGRDPDQPSPVDVEDDEVGDVDVGEGEGEDVGEVVDLDVDDTIRSAIGEYAATLAAGLREATQHPPVRRVVVTLSLLTGLLAFDEYLPLVAAGTDVALESVPVLMTLAFLAQAVASALAGRAARLADDWPPRLLGLGALLIGAGALSGHGVGFAAIAVGYALTNCVIIVIDARLQDAITGPARATITSTVGLGSELVAVAVFTAYAGGSLAVGVGVLVALNALPLLGVSRLLNRTVN